MAGGWGCTLAKYRKGLRGVILGKSDGRVLTKAGGWEMGEGNSNWGSISPPPRDVRQG